MAVSKLLGFPVLPLVGKPAVAVQSPEGVWLTQGVSMMGASLTVDLEPRDRGS